MRIFVKILTVILSALVLLFFTACNNGSAVDLYYFNTLVHIETHDKIMDATTVDQIKATLTELENTFDLKKENSITYRFNQATNGQSFNLSNTEYKLFEKSYEYYQFTDHIFDPTVYPLIELWQFSPSFPVLNFTPPAQNQINDALQKVGLDKISIDGQSNTLTKNYSQTKIDFGGILKGYASDEIARILKEKNHLSGYVNIGGSSLNLLSVDSLGIRHPRPNSNGEVLLTVNTKNKPNLSVSTSGDYERYYQFDNKIYSHIISPLNGLPTTTGVVSATVICKDGAFSDAITTALCLMEHSPSNPLQSKLTLFINKILNSLGDALIFAVYDNDNDKQIITNAIINQDFTLNDSQYQIIKL